MHSPGGIPGVSSVVMWNDTAASRQWSYTPGLVTRTLGTAALGVLSLSALGALYRSGVLGAAVYQATRPHWWAFYNAYKEQADIRHALKGGDFDLDVGMTYRPLRWRGWFQRPLAVAVPFPWFDFQGVHIPVEESSSHGLVQNGGSSAPPPLVQSGLLSDILSLGKISRPQSAHGRSPRLSAARRQRCPIGHRWNGQRCVPIRKR